MHCGGATDQPNNLNTCIFLFIIAMSLHNRPKKDDKALKKNLYYVFYLAPPCIRAFLVARYIFVITTVLLCQLALCFEAIVRRMLTLSPGSKFVFTRLRCRCEGDIANGKLRTNQPIVWIRCCHNVTLTIDPCRIPTLIVRAQRGVPPSSGCLQLRTLSTWSRVLRSVPLLRRVKAPKLLRGILQLDDKYKRTTVFSAILCIG